MADGILKSYLIRLGFKADEQQYRNFQEMMRKTAANAVEMGRALAKIGEGTVVGVGAVGVAIAGIQKGMAALYYSAQRTGSTAKELDTLRYGFEQIGLSADDATASVQALAVARRDNPGLNGLLASMGIKDTDNAKAFVKLLAQMRDMQPFMRSKMAGLFGLDPNIINQAEMFGPKLSGAMRQREQQYIKEGYDPDVAAKKAVEFQRKWDEMLRRWQDVGVKASDSLLPIAEKMLGWLGKLVDLIGSADKATGGWSTELIAVAAAIRTAMFASKLLGVTGVIGRFGGAAAAGEGAAAAGGAGLLGAVALPAIVLAALAGLAWLIAHPDQLKQQVDQIHDMGTGLLSWLKDQAKQIGGMGDELKPAVTSGLASMVKHFEGFRDHIYKDVAGFATWGYGHMVKPGESMAGKNPDSVFGADLANALMAVHRLVKVHLGQNQENALADLVYNIGADRFGKSTLLRKLNSGDYAGAANQFQYWNHALVNGHLQSVKALTDRRAADAALFRSPDRSITVHQKNEYEITSTDPKAAADEVKRRQKDATADMVRNLAGAVQ